MQPSKLADGKVALDQPILTGICAVYRCLRYHDPLVLAQDEAVAEPHQRFENFRYQRIANAMIDAQVVTRHLFVNGHERDEVPETWTDV